MVDTSKILPLLESEERFRPLASYFAERGVEEMMGTGSRRLDEGQEQTLSTVRAAFALVLERCHSAIQALAESPIEQVLLRSLTLSFIKNSQILVFMPAFRNTLTDLAEWQDQLKNLKKFVAWHERRYGSSTITDRFLDEEVRSGRMPAHELPEVKELLLLYHHLPFCGAWHVGLQARFPALVRPRGISRVDMLFWQPTRRSLRLAVECDGFVGHRYKRSFEQDRRRDRALRANGIDVLRFSGSEINADPIGAATELFLYLSKKENKSRVV